MSTSKRRFLNPPSDKELEKGLRERSSEIIDRGLQTRGLQSILSVIDDVSSRDPLFSIDTALFEKFEAEFSLFGQRTVSGYAKSWLDSVRTVGNKRNYTILLSFLVRSINVLQNEEFCKLLKEEIPTVYEKLCSENLFDVAGVLLNILFFISSFEVSYSEDDVTNEIDSLWDGLLKNQKTTETQPCLNLYSFLLKTLMNRDYTSILPAFCEDMMPLDLDQNPENPFFSLTTQFYTVFADHVFVFAAHAPIPIIIPLVKNLVDFSINKRMFADVSYLILVKKRMFNSSGESLVLHFLISAISQLPNFFVANEEENRDSVAVKQLFTECVNELISLTAFDETANDECQKKTFVIEKWGNVLSRFAEYLIEHNSKCRFTIAHEHLINLLFGKECPITAVPSLLYPTLLGIYLMVFSSCSEEISNLAITSSLAVTKSNIDYFQKLLGTLQIKHFCAMLNLEFIPVERISILEDFWTFYFSTYNMHVLLKDCDYLFNLKNNRMEEIFWVDVVLNVLIGLKYLEDVNLTNTLLERLSSCCTLKDLMNEKADRITNDHENLVIFGLFLKPYRILEQVNKELQRGKSTIPAKTTVLKICKKICKNIKKYLFSDPTKYKTDLIVFENIVDFLMLDNTFGTLMKWKYITEMCECSTAVVRNILLRCTLNDLECLFTTDSHDVKQIYLLECCLTIAQMRNNKKQMVFLRNFEFLINMILNHVATNHLLVLSLIRHLLPPFADGPMERDFVSFTLSLLSTSFPTLFSQSSDENDARCFLEIQEILLECLHVSAKSVLNDQCANYIQLISLVVQKIQHNEIKKDYNHELLEKQKFILTKITQAMKGHKEFARIMPFLISECLDDPKCCLLPVYKMLSACDNYSTAMLTSSLPPLRKRHFSTLYPAFLKVNAYVV